MQVHTVKRGESIFGIAREYAVSPRGIIETNGLENPDVLAIGEELLILRPSRNYTASAGDTVGLVARRFGIKREDIFAKNPQLLCDDRLYDGQLLALGYGDARLGMAASNGYLYPGYDKESLHRALPYITYLTVAAAVAEGGRISYLFDGSTALKTAKQNDKIPILRIYLKDGDGIYDGEVERNAFAELLVASASDSGYSGICLSVPECGVRSREYEAFIISLRKRMIGSGLILFTEAICDRENGYADYADGCVLSYDKLSLSSIPSFNQGERRAFSGYAEAAESSKTFMDITSFAVSSEGYLTYGEAIKTAARAGAKISADDCGICSYSYNKKGGDLVVVRYESLKNIIAKLELLGELGYMGISFDINRTPVSHLMAYTALFSGICYTSVFSGGART